MLAKHLTEANYENVLAIPTHKIANVSSWPSWLRNRMFRRWSLKRPQRIAQSKPPTSSGEASADNAERPEPPPAPEFSVAQVKRAKVDPLSPARCKVEFTASADASRQAGTGSRHSCRSSDLAAIIDAAVTEKLERLEAKRIGKTSRPRKNAE